MEIVWLAAAGIVVGALCWGVGLLAGRVLGRRGPYWRTLLPWLAAQAYLAVGLLSAPSPPTAGILTGAGLTGLLTLGVAAARRRTDYPRARALLIAWAIPWATVSVLSLF